jgi:glutathione S-transferase
MIPHAKPNAIQIYGLSGGTWHLPLNLEDDSLEHFPKPSFYHPPNAYKPAVEAAFALMNNHVNITRFACRGAGNPGNPSFHAELADPYAKPNETYFYPVDVCLRHITQALLERTEHDYASA